MKKTIKNIFNQIRIYRARRAHIKSLTMHMPELKHRRKLSKEQKREVIEFYRGMVGKDVSLSSHEYFYSRTGVFTKNYVPKDLYHVDLLPKANRWDYKRVLGDKNLCDIYLAGESIVHDVLKNMNGYFYYNNIPIDEEEALERCKNMGKMIMKPSLQYQGTGVRIINIENGIDTISGKTLKELFDEYVMDFLIEELIVQHKDMAALNPSSVNTLRVLSYRSGMEVLIVYCVIRIGRKGAVVDNQSAGGISAKVDEDGKIGAIAYGGYNEDDIRMTDSGVVLDGYIVPSYDKVVALVKKLHMKLPYLNLIGWDIAVQEDGTPIVIEFNTVPGLSQSAFQSGFGKHTERIIKEIWNKENTEWDIQ